MRDLLISARPPLQSRNFWTKACRDAKWIDTCVSSNSIENDKKATKALWNCYSKQQKKVHNDISCTAHLEKKLSLAEMERMSFVGEPSQERMERLSTPQPTYLQPYCKYLKPSHSLTSLCPPSNCQLNDSEGSLSFMTSKLLPVRRQKFNVFSHLEDVKGNVNSNNKPSESLHYSTSELESSEEEVRAPSKKSISVRSNYRRMSSAVLKKPQLRFQENEGLNSKGINFHKQYEHDNNASLPPLQTSMVHKGSRCHFECMNENKSNKKGVEEEEKDKEGQDKEENKEKKGDEIKKDKEKDKKDEEKREEKDEEKEEKDKDQLDGKNGKNNASGTKAESEGNPSDHEADDYLQTLVGGDTTRPVELKHYNSNEFIGQMMKMRGGWRFNIAFSELQSEQNEDTHEDGEEFSVHSVSSEQPTKEKGQAEFCCSKFRDTFDEFVSRWKDDQLDTKVFKDSNEKPARNSASFEVVCKPKTRKARFSAFPTVPKKFGECEINLFYSPRRCQL